MENINNKVKIRKIRIGTKYFTESLQKWKKKKKSTEKQPPLFAEENNELLR